MTSKVLANTFETSTLIKLNNIRSILLQFHVLNLSSTQWAGMHPEIFDQFIHLSTSIMLKGLAKGALVRLVHPPDTDGVMPFIYKLSCHWKGEVGY